MKLISSCLDVTSTSWSIFGRGNCPCGMLCWGRWSLRIISTFILGIGLPRWSLLPSIFPFYLWWSHFFLWRRPATISIIPICFVDIHLGDGPSPLALFWVYPYRTMRTHPCYHLGILLARFWGLQSALNQVTPLRQFVLPQTLFSPSYLLDFLIFLFSHHFYYVYCHDLLGNDFS